MRRFSDEIDKFIESLARAELNGSAFNQYSYSNPTNGIRRENLRLYFHEIRRFQPRYLLLSEAPGYQGARLTGVPLTSESILLDGIDSLQLFGREKGYMKTAEFERIRKEPSATIVWKTLEEMQRVPLLWGSFPFHPYKQNNLWSNRRPTTTEIMLGQNFFLRLCEIFSIKEIIAVGKVAQENLTNLNMECKAIRHPSHGGASQFAQGLKELLR